MTRPILYYSSGPAWMWNCIGIQLSQLGLSGNFYGVTWGQTVQPPTINIKALDGKTIQWSGGIPADPFPLLLDADLWQYRRVPYPPLLLNLGPSIESGVDWVVEQVLATDKGTPFAVGGSSYGAAVASRVYQEARTGRLSDRRADLRAMVTFGSGMREKSHTYVGSSGYSGSADVPGDTRGGRGAFPAVADIDTTRWYASRFARLQNSEDLVWDFTMPNDPVSGVSDAAATITEVYRDGLAETPSAPADAATIMAAYSVLGKAPAGVTQDGNGQVRVTDAVSGQNYYLPGGGHPMYPFFPPPASSGSIPSTGNTCYQIAASYLRTIGQQLEAELNPTFVAPTVRPTYSWVTSA